MKKIWGLIFVLGCLLSTPAWSSQASSGAVNFYAPLGSSLIFRTSGTRTSAPACATDPYWTIATSGASVNQPLIASILSLYLAKTPFEVYGTGTCDGGREAVAYIIAY